MTPVRLFPSAALTSQLEGLKCRVISELNGQMAGPVVIAFTSCEGGEGVSSVASNFAATLASEDGCDVLLMDGDRRRPSLHKSLPQSEFSPTPVENPDNLPAQRSSAEMMLPSWRIVQAGDNLDVLLARRQIETPGKMFAMAEFGEFLEHARKNYDYTIVDCPPVRGDAGSAVLAAKADATVLVVEAGRSRREVIQRSVIELEEMGANVIGVVLNKRTFPIPEFVYRKL